MTFFFDVISLYVKHIQQPSKYTNFKESCKIPQTATLLFSFFFRQDLPKNCPKNKMANQPNLLIEDCLIFNTDDSSYSTVSVAIVGEKIAAVVPQGETLPEALASTEFKKIAGKNRLLLPGFTNAHTHSSEFWCRGMIDNAPLEVWLSSLIDRSIAVVTEVEHIFLSALHCGYETLMSGGTAIIDHLSLLPGKEVESFDAAFRAYQLLGIRAYVAPLVFDMEDFTNCVCPCPGEKKNYTFQGTDHIINFMAEIVDKYHRPEQGFNVAIGPTGLQLASDDLYRGLVKLSEKHNLVRHTHCLETANQKDLFVQKFGCTGLEQLEKLGFLDHKTTLAHSIHLVEKDMELAKKYGCTLVHNPLSNLRLGSGIAPVLKYRDLGISVAFGCDGAASNDSQDLLEAVKIGSILHNVTDPDYRNWLTTAETISMAAHGGARGVGEADKRGKIEVGMDADLVLYQLDNLSILPKTDPARMLILGRHVDVITEVVVDGRLVIEGKKVVGVDAEDMKKRVMDHSEYDHVKPVTVHTFREATESVYRKSRGLPE